MAKEMKYYVLQEGGKDTEHVFSGKQPRAAALKAATRRAAPGSGEVNIILRERGKKKLHKFVGSVDIVDAPPNRPSWLPAKVKKAKVKKLGIEKF